MKLGLIHTAVPPSPHLVGVLAGVRADVPESVDWLAVAERAAGVRIANGDARGNVEHSCCVPVGAWQALRIMRAVVGGDSRDFTTQQVLGTYQAWASYDGTDATDLGTDSRKAGVLWASRGLRWCDQLLDVPNIVPLGLDHLRAAVALLGPTQVDLALRSDWMPSQTWGASSAALVGDHRTVATGYNSDGFDLLTWGRRVWISNDALAAQGLAAWACVSRDWLTTLGTTPTGLDYVALENEGRMLAV